MSHVERGNGIGWRWVPGRNYHEAAAALRQRLMRELCTINVREHHQLKLRRLDKYVRCAGADGGGAGDYARTAACVYRV